MALYVHMSTQPLESLIEESQEFYERGKSVLKDAGTTALSAALLFAFAPDAANAQWWNPFAENCAEYRSDFKDIQARTGGLKVTVDGEGTVVTPPDEGRHYKAGSRKPIKIRTAEDAEVSLRFTNPDYDDEIGPKFVTDQVLDTFMTSYGRKRDADEAVRHGDMPQRAIPKNKQVTLRRGDPTEDSYCNEPGALCLADSDARDVTSTWLVAEVGEYDADETCIVGSFRPIKYVEKQEADDPRQGSTERQSEKDDGDIVVHEETNIIIDNEDKEKEEKRDRKRKRRDTRKEQRSTQEQSDAGHFSVAAGAEFGRLRYATLDNDPSLLVGGLRVNADHEGGNTDAHLDASILSEILTGTYRQRSAGEQFINVEGSANYRFGGIFGPGITFERHTSSRGFGIDRTTESDLEGGMQLVARIGDADDYVQLAGKAGTELQSSNNQALSEPYVGGGLRIAFSGDDLGVRGYGKLHKILRSGLSENAWNKLQALEGVEAEAGLQGTLDITESDVGTLQFLAGFGLGYKNVTYRSDGELGETNATFHSFNIGLGYEIGH